MPKLQKDVAALEEKAYEIRRKLIVLTGKIGGAHLGGSFSMMEVLVALYHRTMNITPQNPKDPERDIFILSKGHGGVGLCQVLGDLGYFPEEELNQFNQTGSRFGVHPDHKKIPGIEASTGSLGHGLSLAVGRALAKKHLKRMQRVFCIISDGELMEGSIWEALHSAVQFRLGNLNVVIDLNKMTMDGTLSEIMQVEPVRPKLEAIGWNVLEIDGHDMKQVVQALDSLPASDANRPNVIIAHTVKGKGVPWMENTVNWHYGGLDEDQEMKALNDLARYYGKGEA